MTGRTDWPAKPLSAWVTTVKDRVEPHDAGSLPYVGLEHIEKDTGVLLGTGSPSDVRSTKTLFREGDILYGKLRPYLNKVLVAPFDGVCSTDILAFRANAGVCAKFIVHRLRMRDFVRYAAANSKGVNLPRVSPKTIGEFSVSVPGPDEQEAIIARVEELMSEIDAAEQDVDAAAAAMRTFRSHLLRSAFQADRLGGTSVPLNEIFKWASGEGLPEKARRPGPVPVYGGNGVSGWHDEAMANEPAIVVGRVGYYCGNVHVTEGESWITDNCIRSTWHHPKANLRFFAFWLEGLQLNRQSAGTRQKYINQGVLKDLQAPFPDETVQSRVVTEIEEALSLLERATGLLDTTAMQSSAVRQSILASAFCGQLIQPE